MPLSCHAPGDRLGTTAQPRARCVYGTTPTRSELRLTGTALDVHGAVLHVPELPVLLHVPVRAADVAAWLVQAGPELLLGNRHEVHHVRPICHAQSPGVDVHVGEHGVLADAMGPVHLDSVIDD